MDEVRTRDARHRSPRRRRSTSWSFRARRRPASGAFSFGRGLDFPPFLIRSEASLYEAQAEGLHARIRRSSGNSQPLCLIREARRPGTEGAGPILAAACCSHSPARRPAHLGGFSGSVWISFPCLIHETLNRASHRALAPASRVGQAHALGNDAGLQIPPQRDQQFPRERHRHHLADAPFALAHAAEEPAAQRAVRLEPQPAPCQLQQQAAHARVAVLGDALLALHAPALERRAGQADECRDPAPIAEWAVAIPRSGSDASSSVTRAASISAICSLATLCRFIRRRNWAIVCAGSAAPERARNFSSFSAAFFRRGRKSPIPCRHNRLWIWFSNPTRSRTSLSRSRPGRRASSSSTLGTRTIVHTRGSPRSQANSVRNSMSRSMRSVLARRPLRSTGMLAG